MQSSDERNHSGRRLGHAALSGHRAVSKQLLPVYDKPMIYYPLSVLMLAGIRDILLISTPAGHAALRAAAGRRQPVGHLASPMPSSRTPNGLAQAFLIGREFVGGDRVRADPGRQIFYGHGFPAQAAAAPAQRSRAPRSSPTGCATRALRRGRVRRRAARPLARREAAQAAVELGRDRPLFLRQPGGRHRRRTQALGTRRAGNHRRQPRLPRARQLTSSCSAAAIAWLDTGTHESLLQAATSSRPSKSARG